MLRCMGAKLGANASRGQAASGDCRPRSEPHRETVSVVWPGSGLPPKAADHPSPHLLLLALPRTHCLERPPATESMTEAELAGEGDLSPSRQIGCCSDGPTGICLVSVYASSRTSANAITTPPVACSKVAPTRAPASAAASLAAA